ncbi:MAG TPA: septal ring lytic transglycosylase RlpA family protein [Candidatus Nitrosocosmicus sp.]|nr:septal ring lytic transglycosylase RlpA family protein [Candidatus Nitrosocosmicus sp.]
MALLVMLVTAPMVDLAGARTAEEGIASFYSDRFEGKRTANGEIYRPDGLTAAHKKLPHGTRVKVSNLANGKSVVVTINDRMPASSRVVIDVSRRAAERLGFVKAGRARVTLEVQN